MVKKELLGLRTLNATAKMMNMASNDIPYCQDTDYGYSHDVYQNGLYMRCQVLKGILKVAIFLPEYMRMGSNKAAYELFIDKKAKQFLTFDRLHKRWLTSKLDRISWPSYVWDAKEKWISSAGYATIKDYLGGAHGGYIGLLQYQLMLREDELKEKHRRETEAWDLDLAQVPDLPKDWERWVNKVGIQQNYIFYEYSRKGVKTGYCTFCDKEVPIQHPRHNGSGVCPCCRHKITYKSVGKAGMVITDEEWMYLMQKCEDGFVIRKFKGYRKYCKGKYRSPEVVSWETSRTIYEERMTPRAYYWGLYKQFESRWIAGFSHSALNNLDEGKVYGRTLASLAKGELLKTGIFEILRSRAKFDPELYLALLEFRPYLELLAKAGLTRLAIDGMRQRYQLQKIYEKGAHGLAKKLQIDKQRMKRLRANKGGLQFLNWLIYEKSGNKNFKDKIISWFVSNNIEPNELDFIRYAMSEEQVYNYVRRQVTESRMTVEEVLTTWRDYLSMAKKLNLDVNDAIIYRVRKLRLRHDELVKRLGMKDFKSQANEIRTQYPNLDEIIQPLQDKYGYADETYMVVSPTCVEEIILEGRLLSHCVGKTEHYWERIASRESYILFLRKTAEPDKPYYTLEIEPDGTVRQKRSKFDRQYKDIEQAKRFLVKWQKIVTERLSAEDLKQAENSRILRDREFEELRAHPRTIPFGPLHGKSLLNVLLADLMETAA